MGQQTNTPMALEIFDFFEMLYYPTALREKRKPKKEENICKKVFMFIFSMRYKIVLHITINISQS